MTTVADLETTVRRALGDALKWQVDTTTYDGSSTVIPTGRDLPIETGSEVFTVNGTQQTRNSNYSIDYDARQLTLLGTLPASGAALRLRYKESVYKSEQIREALNQGRTLLFPTIYRKAVVSLTTTTLVRNYDLATDINEPAMKQTFVQGHMEYKILRAWYRALGTSDQSDIPFRGYWRQGESAVHLWRMLPGSYTLSFEVAYAFTPLVEASQTTDIPRLAIPLVTEWAISALALKQEPIRSRTDTSNVLQGPYANPPGAQAQCVPLDAEILTRHGFRRCDEVVIGEEVVAYDTGSDSCRWTPLRDVRTFASQSTVRLRSRSLDVLCTPEHKWAVRKSARSLVKTSDFVSNSGHRQNAIIMAAPAEGGTSPVTAEEAALIGWVVTDGYVRYQDRKRTPGAITAMAVTQSKADNVERIRALLPIGTHERVTQAPPRTFPSGRTYATLPGHTFELKTAAARRLFAKAGIHRRVDLPSLVTRLSHEARVAMLDAMLRAEGHQVMSRNFHGVKVGRRERWVFGQKNPHVIEAFQILCALEGRALGRPQYGDPVGFLRQSVRLYRHVNLSNIRVEEGPITDVWCPTTDYGTWIMRWNGQVMITGNTSEDFLRRVEYIRRFLNVEPLTFELPDMPRSWQAALR